MAQEDPTLVLNHDILFIHDMLNRFIFEMLNSQSNGVSGMTVPDQTRMESYIAALRFKKAWIMGQPLLDLPETHPRKFQLEPSPVVVNVESESINQFIRLMEALRTEMINSQSARLASTLIVHDATRFDLVVDKMESFLVDFVRAATPLDLPESSPQEPLQGAGNRGVNA